MNVLGVSCQQGVVGMDDNYISPEFLDDDLQAGAERLDSSAHSSMNRTTRAGEDPVRATAAGSSRIVDFTVMKAISAFELTMLVLTGRNLTLVERSPDE
jgi:hypothetical protein